MAGAMNVLQSSELNRMTICDTEVRLLCGLVLVCCLAFLLAGGIGWIVDIWTAPKDESEDDDDTARGMGEVE